MYAIIAWVHTPTGLRVERMSYSNEENTPAGFALALAAVMNEVREHYAHGSVVQRVELTYLEPPRGA